MTAVRQTEAPPRGRFLERRFRLSDGIGFGVISYVIVMVASGRARGIHPLMWGSRRSSWRSSPRTG